MDNWKISRREFIRICGKSVLLPVGIGISGCVDKVLTDEVKFIAVGDPHVKISVANRGNERLIQVVDFINKSDADFAVFLGDMADNGKDKTFGIIKNILKKMTKPYYVVAGNHDIIESPKLFESYFSLMENIQNFKDYQLLFVGINKGKDKKGKEKLSWSFDFSKANKELPTLVFLHGPVKDPPSECPDCKWGEFFKYAYSMQSELDKFTNLIGVYSGHIHYDSDQTFNGTRYITINGLVKRTVGEHQSLPSDQIGYSILKDNKLDYKLVSYA